MPCVGCSIAAAISSAEFEKVLPDFAFRLQVEAELTCCAQVYGKYNTSFYDKQFMHLMYISHPSILEDRSILLTTIRILTDKESTQGVGEEGANLIFRESANQ